MTEGAEVTLPQSADTLMTYLDKRPEKVTAQVRDASSLGLGRNYQEFEDGRLVGEFALSKLPHAIEGKDGMWITARYNLGGEVVEVEKSLADLAITEYANGKWNAKRWLIDQELLNPAAIIATTDKKAK